MDMKSIGDALREARTDKKISQGELSETLGIPQSVISSVERGAYSNCVTDRHRIIATHFGVQLEEGEEMPAEEALEPSNGASEPEKYKNAPTILFRSIEHLQEIDTLARCVLDIQKLKAPAAQKRVLRYLNDLFGEDSDQR